MTPDDTTPAEAIEAGAHALWVQRNRNATLGPSSPAADDIDRMMARVVLAAAGPVIAGTAAAAQLERIRQLAIERDARWQPTAICGENCTRAPHPYPSGPTAPFADLLTGD